MKINIADDEKKDIVIMNMKSINIAQPGLLFMIIRKLGQGWNKVKYTKIVEENQFKSYEGEPNYYCIIRKGNKIVLKISVCDLPKSLEGEMLSDEQIDSLLDDLNYNGDHKDQAPYIKREEIKF